MGLFHVQIEVLPANGGPAQTHSVLVDTGASYLTLPRSLVSSLGYRPVDRQRVIPATGDTDQTPKLLGAQTLETFGLGVDPLGKRLIPVDAYLA